MTEKQGLRFDIYERVHLAEEVKGLEQLDQIELLPYIQVLSQGDQAVLKGHLLLTGQYDASELRGEALEHTIPVEITLPMNRIPNLEEIGVDIDNFDIDLVAPRTLNVTGVLSLSGIELAQSSAEWTGQDEEEKVFVQQAVEETRSVNEGVSQPVAEERFEEKADINVAPDTPAPMEAAIQPEALNEPPAAIEPAEVNVEPNTAAVENAIPAENALPVENALPIENELPAENLGAEVPAANVEPNVAAAEKKELKIAFTGRKPEEDTLPQKNQLNSLLKKPDAVKDARVEATTDESAQAEEASQKAKTDGMEWKNLFLSRDADEQRQSVRMCIVQKEETMDTIADRYSLNPREIMLYNRMNEQSVREGQILYIPRT